MSNFSDRLKHAWNAFMNKDPTKENYTADVGPGYGVKPDRMYLRPASEKSIINTIITRFSVDCAAINMRHVRLDEQERYLETIDSGLNNCLSIEANVDQTGRALLQDVVASMLDEGVVAVVPTDTDRDPSKGSFEILELRTAKIIQWYPRHVQVRLYNESTGMKEDLVFAKSEVAIIENPFYQIMNTPNSTMARLRRKMALLDVVDDQNASKKLNMIIQLPYIVRNETKRKEAEKRRSDMEKQLAESKYGVAYMDGTEKITQINRPLDTGLQEQVKDLQDMLLSQLGVTMEILNGTATPDTMTNYYSRIIEPILTVVSEEFIRKFLTKTARTQRQSVQFFRDPFKLVPVDKMADLADKFTRNEILTSNEVRQIVGMLPSQDPSADELRNKNISEAAGEEHVDINGNPIPMGPEGVEGLAQEMPPEETPYEGMPMDEIQPEEIPPEDIPVLDVDDMINSLTEEEFNSLPPDEQEVILTYLDKKENENFEEEDEDPELDEMINNLTEDEFQQLSPEEQNAILNYLAEKEKKKEVK